MMDIMFIVALHRIKITTTGRYNAFIGTREAHWKVIDKFVAVLYKMSVFIVSAKDG